MYASGLPRAELDSTVDATEPVISNRKSTTPPSRTYNRTTNQYSPQTNQSANWIVGKSSGPVRLTKPTSFSSKSRRTFRATSGPEAGLAELCQHAV